MDGSKTKLVLLMGMDEARALFSKMEDGFVDKIAIFAPVDAVLVGEEKSQLTHDTMDCYEDSRSSNSYIVRWGKILDIKESPKKDQSFIS